MLLGAKFEAFVEQSSVSVMMRGLVEKFFHPERVDRLFEEHAVTQYTWQWPFSTVAVQHGGRGFVGGRVQRFAIGGGVVAAAGGDAARVSTGVYKKLNGVEPAVGRALVSDSARQLTAACQRNGRA